MSEHIRYVNGELHLKVHLKVHLKPSVLRGVTFRVRVRDFFSAYIITELLVFLYSARCLALHYDVNLSLFFNSVGFLGFDLGSIL